ncbi:hypothetical protein C8Q76DRAFT_803956 [Earliella scabrosa]|nr:hypothetical protein C8Q76DRAFT_803956 [Earliella scabrosa]
MSTDGTPDPANASTGVPSLFSSYRSHLSFVRSSTRRSHHVLVRHARLLRPEELDRRKFKSRGPSLRTFGTTSSAYTAHRLRSSRHAQTEVVRDHEDRELVRGVSFTLSLGQVILCARTSANLKRMIRKRVVRVYDICTPKPYGLSMTISVPPHDCTPHPQPSGPSMSAPRLSGRVPFPKGTTSTYHFDILEETKTVLVEYSLLLRVRATHHDVDTTHPS